MGKNCEFRQLFCEFEAEEIRNQRVEEEGQPSLKFKDVRVDGETKYLYTLPTKAASLETMFRMIN